MAPVVRGEHGVYGREVWFSDWRDAPKVDYSTNALVCNYYTAGTAKYLRIENLAEFEKDLKRDITIGIDYYGLFAISSPIIEKHFPGLLTRIASELERGNVVIIQTR